MLIAFLCSFRASCSRKGLGAASVAGVVKDASGAVLPGVTIEASSPVLIEKVRTTTPTRKDATLPNCARTYSVTYSLQVVTTYKREGLQLTPTSRPTINADLKVGELTETITVSGQTTLVTRAAF